MKNIRLTTTGSERAILINWDNVDFVTEATSHFGDNYRQIHMGNQTVEVSDTIETIESRLSGDDCSVELLEEEAKQYYDAAGTTIEKL